MEVGFRPAPTRKSTSTLFSLVCPDLKSSPAIRTPFCTPATAAEHVISNSTASTAKHLQAHAEVGLFKQGAAPLVLQSCDHPGQAQQPGRESATS